MADQILRMRTLLVCLALAFAPAASADYLYDIWNGQEGVQPYAMVILDTSISMDATDEHWDLTCPYGFRDHDKNGERDTACVSHNRRGDCTERREPCLQRIDAAKASLQRTLPRITHDVGLGLMIFAEGEGSSKQRNTQDSCRVKTIAAPPADYSTIETAVSQAQATMYTPLAWSLKKAHDEIRGVRTGDNASCRDHFVILVTDGDDSCAPGRTDDVLAQIETLRDDGIRTFVIGFGQVEHDVQSNASKFARAGGTAVNGKGEFVCWNDSTCGGETDVFAMFAYDTHELDRMMLSAFDEVRRGIFSAADPVIASVPQRRSEIDRVSRNLMIYSAFEMRGDELRGHLYGIRLFEEQNEYAGDWEYTDLSDPEQVLASCHPDQTCVFDAGQMLVGRTDRKIYTGLPATTPITDEGGFAVPVARAVELTDNDSGRTALAKVWSDFSSFGPIEAALADEALPPPFHEAAETVGGDEVPKQLSKEDLRSPPAALYDSVIDWLHGKTRNWPLGDIYHASPAITEPPAYGYRDRGYPQFRLENQNRPWMIYIGANDGMIHAFYASPDLEQPKNPRWEPGEEAWAYLPMNMIGRTLTEVHASSQRFFSQDLSCRYTDLILDDKVNDQGVLDCGKDPNCGWATVLLCGQGWGGSWYVAIDVTDPRKPRPLWETTVPDAAGTDRVGLGRTWSVPAINLINYDGKPTWMALFGNGYNADMADCPISGSCEGSRRLASYRMLNLPFDGAWPMYGDGTNGDWGHAYLVDMKDGRLRKLLHMHQDGKPGMQSIMADVASIDSDGNGLIDAAYLGGWNGWMARVPFGDTRIDDFSSIDRCTMDGDPLFRMANSRPITSNPSVVRHPTQKDLVYLFVGSGVDAGRAPDQQHSQGGQWQFRAFQFTEEGKSACITPDNNATNLCKTSDWKLSDKARLLGQPLFSRQHDGREWILYTTWTPPQGSCDSGGEARLYCLDVTDARAADRICRPCGDMTGDGEHTPERYAVIDTEGTPPTPPVIADGRVYVGPKATPILDEDGNAPPINPVSSRTVTISWREQF